MATKKSDDSFSAQEIKQRFEAALRGARVAGHTPMKKAAAKQIKSQKKPSKK